jgi:glycosyltransferase involved in cell wall biosynthesis
MRVGIFTNAYRPLISGVVNSVDLIRKGLLRQGHTPFVLAPEFPGYKEQHAGVWRFRSLSLSRQVQFPLPIPYSPRLFRVIAHMRLDVIHTHHPFLLGEVGAHFARRLGIPLVYTFHTQLEQYAHYVPLNQDLVRFLARSSVRAYARKCHCIICPSPTIRGLLEEYGIRTRVELLPNAIDLEAFAAGRGEGVRARLGLSPERVVAIYCGRIAKEKNLELMLRAFARARQEEPRAALVLVGDGPELESLRALACQLGQAEHVLFPGRVDYREIPSYYAAADLFVMTSVTEVKPLAILEAMASGLPVVAVAASGSQDTVTHETDGLLCPHDEEAFRQILVRALRHDGLRARLGQAARATAAEYGIERYTRRLLDIYASLKA